MRGNVNISRGLKARYIIAQRQSHVMATPWVKGLHQQSTG